VIERASALAHNDAAFALARGRALLDLGEVTRAHEAFNVARKSDDPRMVAAAVLGLGARWVFGDNLHELIAMIDHASSTLPASERELHARLLARKAAALTPAADPAPVLEIAREAQRLIAGSNDIAARLEVAVAVGAAFTDFAPPRERIAVDETVVELARARGDRALELRGLTRLVADHFTAGDFARGDALLQRRDGLAWSLLQPRFAWHEPLFRSMQAMKDGDFATCEAAVTKAESYAAHDPNCSRACAIHRTWLYAAADRVDELRAHEPVVLAAIRTMHQVLARVIRAFVRLRSGELADARREVEALDADVAHGRAPAILSMLGEVVADVGPESMQRDIYDWLSPHAAEYATFGPFGLVIGPPVAAVLGNLAAAFGEPERARAHFESALAMTTGSGAHVGRAWTLYWFGRAFSATDLLDDAIREATRLGMPNLVARCRAIDARRTTTAPRPSPAVAWTIAEQSGTFVIEHAGKRVVLPPLRGMAMLARLAAQPHVEIHSLELVSGAAGADVDTGDAGELLDDKARNTYRKRVAELAVQIEDAKARGDVARAEAAEDEHDQLLKELSRAVGLGGKTRRAGAATERARVSAHRCLREAIKKIGDVDGVLGAHLTKAVRTGAFCAYRP
jgi:tetratricopeptide (TPR) repeat protein